MDDDNNDLTSLSWLLTSNVMPKVNSSEHPIRNPMLASGSSLPGPSSTIPKAANPVSNNTISKSKSSGSTKKSSNSTPTGNSTSNKKKLLVSEN